MATKMVTDEEIDVPFNEAALTPVKKKKASKKKSSKGSLAAPKDSSGVPEFSAMAAADLDEFVETHGIELEGWGDLPLVEKRKTLAGLFGQPWLSVPSDVFSDTGTIATPQTFAEIVAQVEGISSEQEAYQTVSILRDSKDLSEIRTGGILLLIRDNGWTDGNTDFYAFVSSRFMIEKRKAQSLMQIYRDLSALNLADWEKFKGLGWGKLRAISSILTNENYEKILQDTQGMTLVEITAYSKAYKKGHSVHHPDDQSTPSKILKIPIHEDQEPVILEALAKAKKEGGTDYDGPALQYMAIDYLNSGAKPVPSLKDAFMYVRAHSENVEEAVNQIIHTIKEVFPEVEFD